MKVTPLTTAQAERQFSCHECREYPGAIALLAKLCKTSEDTNALNLVASPTCIGECVIGGTSSCHCAHCSERVWFPSYQLDWKSGPVKVFVCPYCNGGNQ